VVATSDAGIRDNVDAKKLVEAYQTYSNAGTDITKKFTDWLIDPLGQAELDKIKKSATGSEAERGAVATKASEVATTFMTAKGLNGTFKTGQFTADPAGFNLGGFLATNWPLLAAIAVPVIAAIGSFAEGIPLALLAVGSVAVAAFTSNDNDGNLLDWAMKKIHLRDSDEVKAEKEATAAKGTAGKPQLKPEQSAAIVDGMNQINNGEISIITASNITINAKIVSIEVASKTRTDVKVTLEGTLKGDKLIINKVTRKRPADGVEEIITLTKPVEVEGVLTLDGKAINPEALAKELPGEKLKAIMKDANDTAKAAAIAAADKKSKGMAQIEKGEIGDFVNGDLTKDATGKVSVKITSKDDRDVFITLEGTMADGTFTVKQKMPAPGGCTSDVVTQIANVGTSDNKEIFDPALLKKELIAKIQEPPIGSSSHFTIVDKTHNTPAPTGPSGPALPQK